MATLFEYFKKQSLPTSSETGLPEAVTRGANDAVRSVLEEERSGTAVWEENEITLNIHQNLEQRSPSTLCSVEIQQL